MRVAKISVYGVAVAIGFCAATGTTAQLKSVSDPEAFHPYVKQTKAPAKAQAPGASPNLDAPIVPAKPTIRSEFKRGMDAAQDCSFKTELMSEMRLYAACIDAAHNQNRQQMGTGFEAFDLGLYHRARDEMRIAVGG